MPIIRGDDRQRLIAEAVVQVLTCLIDETDYARADLRTIRSKLCSIYRITDPMAPANATSVAQDLAEEDGDAVQD